MTTAAAVLEVRAGAFTRPASSQSLGVFMEDDRRQRLVATIDADAMRALDALAAARYGGNRSRALDDCLTIGAAVLNRPGAFGLDAAAALAAFCEGKAE